MTKQEFREFYQNKLIYLDGATGSNLQKAGMPTGVCPEQWILEHPDAILELQRAFVEAGTNILYAPTFTANRIKLAEYGLEDHLVDMNTELVRLAKQAAGGKALVAGDITMTGRQLTPMGDMDFEELIDVYKEQIRVLDQAGVDLLVVETMMSLQETRAALIAAKEVSSLPVIASLTFESDNKTLFGTDPMTAMLVLQALGADVVGTNCSTGPDQMCEVVRQMKQVAKIPVLAKPNAGLPKLDSEGRTVYEMDAETFGKEMCLLVEAGATFLGGCCGTTVNHIRSMVEKTSAMELPAVEEVQNKGIRYLTSERKTLAFGLDDRFHIVGERINPTGKKKFQACIRDNDFSMVEEFVTQQEESGASILDINMGMSGIDEKETLLKVMEDVSMQTSLPLCIDSSHVDVQEYVLRHYPGRALINSISMESAKMEPLLQIAKKYGAMFILLPVSDEGLPKDLDEKKEIIQKILHRALELGFTKEDIVVDGLVATVGANKNAALETLETIRYCKEQGLATICGLSNISFGLPERSYINAAFLTMAIANGLTMAIANPNQELLTSCMLASDLLLHKQDADLSYIEVMNERKQRTAGTVEQKIPAAEKSVLQKVYECVLKGNKTKIIDQVHAALKEHEAQQILNEALLPAINEVGDLFDKGIYFLPQLIASAEAMKTAIEDIQPLLLAASDGKPKATIVIATVEGDIHDIGKNLVALMLKNYGFRVIDLGKDVPKEVIIETAKKEHADIIALSALMTTTMQQMKHVIEYAKEQGVTAKVLIGGAVITQEYADEIGADGYSKDAAEAVKVAKQVLGLRD
ncbi:homocysteine S-methyltransferase family protein [Kineothrix sp. MSJ-39]|uniref:homocysteine S-methyltransferase family protein n=1 Tax=Kineothrix sp. MSJ-39 TaxID=2841533 RepID=UPI001C1140F9|nr:homocysteine S-methyltransferase family protein [Kineothrix sp. MSJ-39]MBU5428677.1 homocysteine S-methyltransferase family protein [Kineothrix sp. MSJ-39]